MQSLCCRAGLQSDDADGFTCSSLMIRSRAAVAWAPGEPLDVTEIDVAPPRFGEVLLRVVATGVCHTDAYTL